MEHYFQRSFFALQRCLVPLSGRFDGAQHQTSLAIVERFINNKPKAIRFKFLIFLIYIDMLSLLLHARLFCNLPPTQQNNILLGLFHSRMPLLRKGFWGLCTLAKMSVYGQPSVYPWIGYHLKNNELQNSQI